jgi:hypothetical protein
MGFSKIYLSEHVENPEDLAVVHRQITKLGFDPITEIPKPFAHSQVTEGYDTYDEIRENLQIDIKFMDQDARVSFDFRSIQIDYSTFKLIDIEAQLLTITDGKWEKIAEKSFGEKAGFATKDQMLHEVIELSEMVQMAARIKPTKDLDLSDRLILGAELTKLGFGSVDKVLKNVSPFLGDLLPGDPIPKLSEAPIVLFAWSESRNPIDYVFSAERHPGTNALSLTTILAYTKVNPNELHNDTKIYSVDYKLSDGPLPMRTQMDKEVEDLTMADRLQLIQALKQQNTIYSSTSKLRM